MTTSTRFIFLGLIMPDKANNTDLKWLWRPGQKNVCPYQNLYLGKWGSSPTCLSHILSHEWFCLRSMVRTISSLTALEGEDNGNFNENANAMRIGISSFAIGSSYFAQQATKPLVCVHENYDHLRLHWDLTKGEKKNFKSSDTVHSEVCLQTLRTFQFFKRAHKERG